MARGKLDENDENLPPAPGAYLDLRRGTEEDAPPAGSETVRFTRRAAQFGTYAGFAFPKTIYGVPPNGHPSRGTAMNEKRTV